MNTTGNLFRVTTFGESHGVGLWVVIDGMPAWYTIDRDAVKHELARRKPGQSNITTARKENDEEIEVMSGVFEGQTTWHPIAIIVRNTNQRSKDYTNIKDLYRPNHADLTYDKKYGVRDYRGWGRSSGRETLSRVIAGALAKQYLLQKTWLTIHAYTYQVGDMRVKNIDLSTIEDNKLRTADPEIADAMVKHVEEIAKDGNSIGGIVECVITNPPIGLGEPVFDKIKARLASSMLSLGGVLWFEYGAGFDTVHVTGKDYNEWYENVGWKIQSENNRYGGIQWWISTGEPIVFRIAVKPTSSIYTQQKTVDTEGNNVDFQISGRHDPCILPRVVPVVEAMAAIDLLDLWLIDKARA